MTALPARPRAGVAPADDGGSLDTWRDRALLLACRVGARPFLALPLPWAFHRRAAGSSRPPPSPPGLLITRTPIAGIPGRVTSPAAPRGTILWLHGGGFVLGSSGGVYANLAAALARATGMRVVVPDYRLAPEHPFPAGHDDCLAVARALAADAFSDGPFVLGGDSAGGCLALAVLAALLADGTPPARVLLASPVIDLDPARPVPLAPGEVMLPLSAVRRFLRDYLGSADIRDPRVSPVHADFAGAPPVLIQCARGELLEGDADAIAARLAAAGAAVTLQKESGVPHAWPVFAGRTPKADRAIAAMAKALA